MGEIAWGTVAAVLAAPFVLLLPGWALLSLLLPPESFEPESKPDGASWLILAAGLSLALTPVGLLLLYLIGIKIGPGIVLGYLAASAALVLWRRGPAWLAWLRTQRAVPWRQKLAWLDAPLVALILVLILILGVRLWVVRDMGAGAWGDSYQHTMISQLIQDNGGLFQSWEPYAPLRSLTYHFGLHGNVALFQWASEWLTGNTLARTLVLTGQFLNVLAALALYPLAVRLSGRNRWAGVVAVLIAGLLSLMPMFYVNWGRYTQLAGQAILPVVLWLLIEALDRAKASPGRWLLAGLALGGLGLTHYRVVLFVPCFLAPLVAWQLWKARHDRRRLGQLVAGLAVIGGLSLLIVLPWFLNLFKGEYPSIAAGVVQDPNAGTKFGQAHLYESIWQWIAWPLALLSGLGAVLALWQRRAMNLVSAWTAMLFLLANPHWLGLPGTGLVDNFSVIIALYMPVSMLAGYLAGEGIEYAGKRWPPARTVAVGLILVAGVAGMLARSSDVLPSFQMVTSEDQEAMAWIEANTAPEARFLVNGFFAFGGAYVVGADAGWWLPLLAGRANTMPPLLYSSEMGAEPDYLSQVNELMQYVEDAEMDDPATALGLRERGISHVYIGAKGGRIGEPDTPLLDASVLQASPDYQDIYHQGGVWIFQVSPEGEPGD